MSKCVCFTNDTHTLNENPVPIHPVYHKPDLILLLPLWMLPKSYASEILLSSKRNAGRSFLVSVLEQLARHPAQQYRFHTTRRGYSLL